MSAPIPFGNYELVERIAEGGMAEVWRARSRGVAGFEKTVVIKRVLPALLERPGFAELLVREAKIAARLSHPNVIQIFDLGEQEGSYFIAMEYLRGRDLAAALGYRAGAETPLALSLRLWIAAEVAKALDYAHRAKGEDGKPLSIVHRDVSPQNVLLGFEGEVKVADFGISRADEPGLGRGEDPRILRGKYAYMSPEQARGEPIDRRSDIFSFGILLYELAARRRMFRGRSSAETLELVRAARLPDYARRLPLPELAPILARCLAADRAERFGSAAEIHEALARIIFALGEPVGQTDLARAMVEMFPPSERVRHNKLRDDLLVRAYEDATSAGDPARSHELETSSPGSAGRTAALPTSRRLQRETRRLAFLVARARPGDEPLFRAIVADVGGSVLSPARGANVAAFGAGALERPVGHAATAALELRRRSRLEGPARLEPAPAMVIVAAQGAVLEGAVVEADEHAIERALALLGAAEGGELRVPLELEPELGRELRLRQAGEVLIVEGYRSRRDRDAGELRRHAPLVGRRQELRALSGLLADASAGRGALVHLIGEPGVGKSRLLAELRAAAAPQDFVFVQGRADEAEERSFGALADLVLDLCGIELEDAPLQRFEKVDRLRVLGLSPREVRLLGELVGLAYPLPRVERIGRPRAVELALAIRKAIRALARDRVVVLALEDLQWMDDATRQVLPLITKGLVDRGRVLVLVAQRPGGVGPMPEGGRLIAVPPLDQTATGRLLAHFLGARAAEPELAELVRTETGGIPAWIERVAEVLRDRVIIEEGLARLEGEASLEVPEAIRALVAARIERLRPTDRALLRVAAAVGAAGDVELLSSVEGLIGHSERPALRRLLVRQLLVPDDVSTPAGERPAAWGGDEEDERLPTRVRVASELLRRAVLAELEEGELARLHARIVATLERLGVEGSLEGIERLARHAAQSAGRRRAPDYLERAAQVALEAGLPERAAQHLVQAAAIVREETGDVADPRAFSLGLAAAQRALTAGALELAATAIEPLRVGVARVEDRARVVELALLEASLAARRLDARASVDVLSRVVLDGLDAELRARARLAYGRALLEAGATAEAVAALTLAVDEAGGVAQGRGLAALGVALVFADRLDEADEAVSRALAVAARTGAPDLRWQCLAALAAVHGGRGELEDARDRCGEALEVARAARSPDAGPALVMVAALAAMEAEDDAATVGRAELAEQAAREARHEGWSLVASVLKATLAVRADPQPMYVPRMVRDIERLEALSRPLEAAYAIRLLAHAHLALGDRAAAGRTLERAAAQAMAAGHQGLARGLRDGARRVVDGASDS